MTVRDHFIVAILAALGAAVWSEVGLAQAASFPDRPIRFIVPFSAGGGMDVYARLVAEKIKQGQGHTIVVENRTGGNGTVGAGAVKNAEPDGYTLLFSAAVHVMAKQVMKTVPYDPLADFAPIARVGEAPMMLVMAPDRAPASITELLREARAQPDKWTFGTAALGSPGHLATVAFNHLSGLNLTIVTYRGTAPALTDVAGGHVQLLIDPVIALLPMANEGKVKGLAVTSAKRTKLAPNYPTAAESGLPGLEHATWYGVWGPKTLPAELVTRLNEIMSRAVHDLDREGRLARAGIEPVMESPERFAAYAKAYLERNTELLKSAKFDPL
jgi:tripartite-type tricarboxylate transporter receptor subunit TctC